LIEVAFNGEEALELVKKDVYSLEGSCSFNLIFMDCNMPFMDGFECTSKIRDLFYYSFGKSIYDQPLICAVTGHVEEQYIKKCF